MKDKRFWVSAEFSPELDLLARVAAAKERISRSELVRRAVREYAARIVKEDRDPDIDLTTQKKGV